MIVNDTYTATIFCICSISTSNNIVTSSVLPYTQVTVHFSLKGFLLCIL